MNLRTEMRENDLYVIACETKDIASINLKRKFKVDTNFFNFTNKLTEDEQEKLYVMLTKLAETEPEDREDEKKYLITQAEIEKIKEKFNTDLKEFEIVEVKK